MSFAEIRRVDGHAINLKFIEYDNNEIYGRFRDESAFNEKSVFAGDSSLRRRLSLENVGR